MPTDNAIVLAKPKHGLLPILTVLFVVSYGLMALLVVEQARTIDAQRYLIRSLFDDSTQLSALKGKIFQKERADAQAHANSQAQNPSTQAAPPDSGKNKNNNGNKLRKQAPQKPPRPASDLSDERRALISI